MQYGSKEFSGKNADIPISFDDVEVVQYLYSYPVSNEPMEVFQYSGDFSSRTPEGICIAGGIYPFEVKTLSENCYVKPIMDVSLLCWEVYIKKGNSCPLEVYDATGQVVQFEFVPQTDEYYYTVIAPGNDLTTSEGGGGGCNTASEFSVLAFAVVLIRLIGKRLKQVF